MAAAPREPPREGRPDRGSDRKPDRRRNQDSPKRYALRRKWYPRREHRGGVGGGDYDFMADEQLYRPARLGSTTVEPQRAGAGVSGPALSIAYTAGADGLEAGGEVSFVAKGIAALGGAFQVRDPGAPCYVRFTAPPGCSIQPFDPGDWKATFPIGFRVVGGGLQAGDTVRMEVGPDQGFTWTRIAGRKEIKVCVKPRPKGPEYRLPEPLVITVDPGPPELLEVTLPGTGAPGKPVEAIVTARDRFDNRASVDGVVEVEGAGRVPMRRGLASASVDRPGGDPGPARPAGRQRPPGPEPLRVTATLQPSGPSGTSNPCVCSADRQLYFGDLHAHDLLSEAEGYSDELYRWAREDRGFDFVAVSPQSHGWHDNETWTMTKYMNERHHEPGRFVTLLSYEWQHSGYGDKVVHYLGGDQPCLYADDPRYDTPEKLYRALRRADAFVISHHPAYPLDSWVPGTDYARMAPDVERLIELWSMHGSSEGYAAGERPLKSFDPANYVMEALRRGLRIGFVAGSDTHKGRPGGSYEGQNPPNWGGLAAVWAPELSRRSLFEAFRARRTCALTRSRIVLRVTANGAWMGEEIPFAEAVDIRIDAWAPGPIRAVELLKDTRLLREFAPNREECHLEHEERIRAPAFFHCRVILEDGNLAVSSPIWIG